MDIEILPATPGDAGVLATMARSLIEDGLPRTWTVERVSAQIRHPECAVIVARDGRRLAGFASMQFLEEHAHLALLAVRTAYRQHGVGRRLLEWLEACAVTAGTFEIRLELRESNAGAYAFYEHLGYRRQGRARGYYSGREDAIRMTRDLSRASASL